MRTCASPGLHAGGSSTTGCVQYGTVGGTVNAKFDWGTRPPPSNDHVSAPRVPGPRSIRASHDERAAAEVPPSASYGRSFRGWAAPCGDLRSNSIKSYEHSDGSGGCADLRSASLRPNAARESVPAWH